MFNASAEMLEIGIPALKTISLSFVFAGVSIVLCSNFPGAGRRDAFAVGVAGPPADSGTAAGLVAFRLGRAEQAVAGVCDFRGNMYAFQHCHVPPGQSPPDRWA